MLSWRQEKKKWWKFDQMILKYVIFICTCRDLAHFSNFFVVAWRVIDKSLRYVMEGFKNTGFKLACNRHFILVWSLTASMEVTQKIFTQVGVLGTVAIGVSLEYPFDFMFWLSLVGELILLLKLFKGCTMKFIVSMTTFAVVQSSEQCGEDLSRNESSLVRSERLGSSLKSPL